MQYTLIPGEERKALRREYRVRAAIVLCFGLSAASVIGIGALFPAFVRAVTDRLNAEADLSSIQKDNRASGLADIEKGAAQYGSLIADLATTTGSTADSAIIQNVVSVRGPVRISSLSVSRSSGAAEVSIQGIAPRREDLLSFKARLEGALAGGAVDLPISELANSTDVPYSINVAFKLP